MARYIKLDDAVATLHKYFPLSFDRQDAEDDLKSIPAADVEEVRHGAWEMIPPPKVFEDGAYVKFRCSECGTEYESSGRYCPNCWARMDGKEKNDD